MSEGMRPDGPDNHPRMAELYDLEQEQGGPSDSDAFFLAVANRRPRSRIVDLGCGTGTCTIALAADGHAVTGVEPNAAFLARARTKPGAERVTWIEGTSSALPVDAFDLALMTGHVAQAFVDDDEWQQVLVDLRRSLVDGGTLAFDSRDPAAKGWEAWAGGWSGTFESDGGAFVTSSSIVAIAGDRVTFEVDTTLPDGERRHGVSDYRFRSLDELRRTVEAAGFVVDEIVGGWAGQPVGEGDGELIVLATATATVAPPAPTGVK